MKRIAIFWGIVFSLILFTLVNAKTAHAYASPTGYSYAKTATKSVYATKNLTVYRVTVGDDEAHNQFKKDGKIQKGYSFKASNWIMSTGGGYVVKGKGMKATHSHFYFVFGSEKHPGFVRYK